MSERKCLECGALISAASEETVRVVDPLIHIGVMEFFSQSCKDFALAEDKKIGESKEAYALRKEIDELHAALRAPIERTVKAARASGKYAPYAWSNESYLRQALRAQIHLAKHIAKGCKHLDDDGEDDGAHAVTRLAILYARLKRRKEEQEFMKGIPF